MSQRDQAGFRADWVDSSEIARLINVSKRTLWRLREQGLLQEGHHFVRKNPLNYTGPTLWDVDAVCKTLRAPRPKQPSAGPGKP